MMSRKLFGFVAVGMVCVLAFSGCTSKRKKGSGLGDDNIGGVTPSDVYGDGLSDRPLGNSELAGQFQAVYFEYDSSQINEGERSKLETVAEYLRSNTAGGIIIEGHCDERGSAEYNLALGERRALSARAYLVGLGIDGARLQTKSLGEEKPVCYEHDESCWAQNRRDEFVIFQ